jgi:hypothetical protein
MTETHQSLADHVTGEQGSTEQHDHERRSSGFASARRPASPRAPIASVAMAATGDGSAEAHNDSRCNADPEQSLGQCEHTDDDRARAWAQTDRHDRGKPTPEPMTASQFLRLRCVRVTPGRGILVMLVTMGMRVVVGMIVFVRMMRGLFAAQQTQESTAFNP